MKALFLALAITLLTAPAFAGVDALLADQKVIDACSVGYEATMQNPEWRPNSVLPRYIPNTEETRAEFATRRVVEYIDGLVSEYIDKDEKSKIEAPTQDKIKADKIRRSLLAK